MILTQDQENALKDIKNWWNLKLKQLFFLNGYAGTGKTTLIKYLISDLNIDLDNIAFVTYTGKASLVIKQKHGYPCTTIHKRIYKSFFDKKSKKLISIKRSKKELENIQLFILDECSMVSNKIMRDLMFFEKPIICIGDKFQLPPVSNESYFYKDYKADSNLEEITRQALENPIIRLSLELRNNTIPKKGEYGDSVLIDNTDNVDYKYLLGADQVICGYNQTRIQLNKWFRQQKFNEAPVNPSKEDKIICLKNEFDTDIVNGQLFIIKSNPINFDNTFEADLEDIATKQIMKLSCSKMFINKQMKIDVDLSKEDSLFIDYGYCITCHKSQGSQWENVIVFNEPVGNPYRWLYTAITRASDKLIICY